MEGINREELSNTINDGNTTIVCILGDDIIIRCLGSNEEEVTNRINNAIKKAETWLMERGMGLGGSTITFGTVGTQNMVRKKIILY